MDSFYIYLILFSSISNRCNLDPFKHNVWKWGAQFWISGIVVACVCLSVCPSVCVSDRWSVCQPWACLHDNFKPWSLNLNQSCKTPWLRSRVFRHVIDLDLSRSNLILNQNLPHYPRPSGLSCLRLCVRVSMCVCMYGFFVFFWWWWCLSLIFKVKFNLKFLVSPLQETHNPQKAMST